ncbi:MAG TPA: LysR family transcriptional regulator [Steroidobacteraceae bacterium]|jgi:DNA-binding transcriptional LysR family regulator
MDLRLLRYFIACVEHKTMHSAAAAVSVSQPALSKAIRSLEAELGVMLLDREPRGVVPTPFGDTLFRYAKMMDAEMRRAVFEIDAMRGVTRGTVVVGVIPTMCGTMANVGRLVLSRYPGLRLILRVAFSTELAPSLLEGDLDVALLLMPLDNSQVGITFDPLLLTRPVLVAREGHPLTGRENITVKELAEYPWMMPQFPQAHRLIINQTFMDAGVTPPVPAINVSTAIFFDALIRQTDMVTVVPSTLLNNGEKTLGLEALRTNFPFPDEAVGIAYRQNSTLLPGARTVIELMRECCAESPGYISPK